MKHNRLLRAAGVIWGLMVLSAAMLPGATLAKYTAQGGASAAGRVALWDPAARFDDFAPGDPFVLLFGSGPCATKVTLPNGSEVAARYQLVPEVDSGTVPVITITGVTPAGCTYSGLTVDVPPGTTAEVTLSIAPAVFTGLEIAAVVTQVD